MQAETIFDTEHDRYQLVYVGWREQDCIYCPILHLNIISEKIWIQQDGIEVEIANELVELGVPKEDIVLGFQLPSVRKHTDFTVS
ncbi:XisI protein [Nostoc sp.]|uniref:XisI protein n=1 Tax=Nostoc sp. TaxID=1180 RepID=UPI002FF6DE47